MIWKGEYFMKDNNESEKINDMSKKFNGVSIASLIFCIIGIFVAGLPCGLIAIITGIIGIVTFKHEKEKGRWMAITGLVIGVIEVIVMALYVIVQVLGLVS